MRTGGEATRARILDAARVEFAQYGVAGARVDRISDEARANKAQLYSYFKSKEGLFDVVLAEALEAIVDAVPVAGADLADYAVRLYDEYLVRPEMVRLATWARLERHPVGGLTDHGLPGHDEKLASIAAAQDAGLVDPSIDPLDILNAVIAMSMTWSPASTTFAASAADAEPEHARRRELLRTLVTRAFAPPTPSA